MVSFARELQRLDAQTAQESAARIPDLRHAIKPPPGGGSDYG
jgi:hypothetical protein